MKNLLLIGLLGTLFLTSCAHSKKSCCTEEKKCCGKESCDKDANKKKDCDHCEKKSEAKKS